MDERCGTVQSGEKKSWRDHINVYKIPSEAKKTLLDREGGQSLERVAWRGCGVSVRGDI